VGSAAAVADWRWSGYQTWTAGGGIADFLLLTVMYWTWGAFLSGMLLQERGEQILDVGSQSPLTDCDVPL